MIQLEERKLFGFVSALVFSSKLFSCVSVHVRMLMPALNILDVHLYYGLTM